ncbi:hypothetical protein GDO86_004035 [Hymenochirus boettgeri]|uniref:Ileal sodium/bile acid cotransporter n=1 Tax=Hymenochirus boettgeri TaxID=247094 RepID=A0A8T2K8X4_9PIPI|nr:hypothetical protein GDO86_004035 [Hymenochirus boettgeri]
MDTCSINAKICSGTSCLKPVDNSNAILNVTLSTVITTLLALVMFSLGCSVEFQKFWGHIKKPWGIAVGFLCQFGIMPLTGFVLSLVFNILPIQAAVVLIMGCCPGGIGSNIWAYWIDGDMDLSISMTTCSTLLALAVIGGVLYKGAWTIHPKLWILGTIFPGIGFAEDILGLYIKSICKQCRTVALETGIKHPALYNHLQLSFSPEQLELMFTFPLIYSIFKQR